jgi:MFS family permease
MPSPGGYAAALVVFGLGFGLSQPLSMVMMSDLAEARVGGLAMGLRFTAIMAANLSGPVMLGLVAEAVGLPLVFYAAAALVAMFGVATVVLRPNLLPQRREEHSAT